MSAARDEILGRIRSALRDVPEAETPDDVAVARGYRRDDERPAAAVRELFVERAGDYSARVTCVAAGDVSAAIGRACAGHGARRVVVPAGLPDEWRPDGVELVEDDGLSHADLDAIDGVVTGCAAAIAETGTVALDGGPDQGRRAITLVPDLHVCVVPADRIVASVPEATARLAEAVRDGGRPVTLISGPSATSDIELQRVEGVHGPRALELIVVD